MTVGDEDAEEAMRHLLALLDEHPDLLEAAPEGAVRWDRQGAALEARVEDEVHPCLRCGEVAGVAFLARARHDGTWRWLDLCHGCGKTLVGLATRGWPWQG